MIVKIFTLPKHNFTYPWWWDEWLGRTLLILHVHICMNDYADLGLVDPSKVFPVAPFTNMH